MLRLFKNVCCRDQKIKKTIHSLIGHDDPSVIWRCFIQPYDIAHNYSANPKLSGYRQKTAWANLFPLSVFMIFWMNSLTFSLPSSFSTPLWIWLKKKAPAFKNLLKSLKTSAFWPHSLWSWWNNHIRVKSVYGHQMQNYRDFDAVIDPLFRPFWALQSCRQKWV